VLKYPIKIFRTHSKHKIGIFLKDFTVLLIVRVKVQATTFYSAFGLTSTRSIRRPFRVLEISGRHLEIRKQAFSN
jgi:hypothetical protein